MLNAFVAVNKVILALLVAFARSPPSPLEECRVVSDCVPISTNSEHKILQDLLFFTPFVWLLLSVLGPCQASFLVGERA